MFGELNKVFQSPFTKSADFAEVEFTGLEPLFENYGGEHVFKVADMWINQKSKFGAHPVAGIVNEDGDAWYNVSLPKHMTEVVEAIISTPEMVNAVNAGACGFTIREYYSKTYKKKCYSVNFVDV